MTRARLLRELRHVGQAWCIVCAIGATAGGLYGWLTWPERNDT